MARSLFHSEISNNFGHWMFTHRFLFLEFNFEAIGVNILLSGNDGITTFMGLTVRDDGWGGGESIFEVNSLPGFVHVIDGSNNQLETAGKIINTSFSNNEVEIFSGVRSIKIIEFFNFEFKRFFRNVLKSNVRWMSTIISGHLS